MATVLTAFSTLQRSLFFLCRPPSQLLFHEPSRALLPPGPQNYTGIIIFPSIFRRPETHWRSRPISTPNPSHQPTNLSQIFFRFFFQTFFSTEDRPKNFEKNRPRKFRKKPPEKISKKNRPIKFRKKITPQTAEKKSPKKIAKKLSQKKKAA